MAYTEIHPITATVHKAIKYICNPDKTDDSLLVSSFGCSPDTAHFDFAFTRQNAAIQSPNLAYHLIQAFKPGEVTPEEAHAIGQELADRLLKGKYSYVVSTHIDKGHVHNHIIFNAVDNEKYEHYNDCDKTYYHIRNLSDKLCQEHHLSVIENTDGKRGKSWYEWRVTKDGDSWKQQLKKDINKSIQLTDNFDEFLAFMKAKGYQIKLGKYISFCPPGKEKFVRGSVKSLGKNYTQEQIRERIKNKPKTNMRIPQNRLQYLLGLPVEMLEAGENAGLKKWATKENLKRISETYNQMTEQGLHSFEELHEKMEKVKEQRKELRSTLKDMENQQKHLKEAMKYLGQYSDTKEVYQQYKKAYFKDRFFREHEGEIIIHGAAQNYFKQQGMNPEELDLKKLKGKFDKLNDDKASLKNQIKKLEKQDNNFQKMNENLKEYLQIGEAEKQVKKDSSIEY